MKLIQITILIVIFIAGLLIGFCTKNFHFIGWNKEVKIYEVFQVLSTLFIGLVIPFMIKKWIEDGRNIKSLLIEEGKEIMKESQNIKDKLFKFHEERKISGEDKQYLLLQFTILDNALTHLQKNLQQSFKMKGNSQFQDLKIAYYIYWKSVTGGQLMSETFNQIDIEFLNLYSIEHNKFQSAIRFFMISLQTI
jgi:hypothetical protein